MEPVRLRLGGERDAVLRPGLGFLERRRFVAKTLGFVGWKSVDFLGFSSSNRDLLMCYTRFSADFSLRFCRRERAVETATPRFVCEKDVLFMGQA
jgi:hypothetical protein